MTNCCPTCGADCDEKVAYGQLQVSMKPPAAFWRGRILHELSPAHVRILTVLARTGAASHFALYLTLPSQDASSSAVKVHICTLRQRLPDGLRIINIHGWGYRLEAEE